VIIPTQKYKLFGVENGDAWGQRQKTAGVWDFRVGVVETRPERN